MLAWGEQGLNSCPLFYQQLLKLLPGILSDAGL
jgi:hypothetical protein